MMALRHKERRDGGGLVVLMVEMEMEMGEYVARKREREREICIISQKSDRFPDLSLHVMKHKN